MDNSTKLFERSFISPVKPKHIFLVIIFFMIISLSKFFNSSNSNNSSLHLIMTKKTRTSIQTTTSELITTTTTTTTTATTSSTSTHITSTFQRTSTIKNFDEILCDNLTEYRTSNISRNPCERIRCAIILRASGGRLGNRMFIYASAYGLARTHNCRLHVSTSILNELSNSFQMKSIDEKMWLAERDINQLQNIQIKNTVCSFLPELLIPNAFTNIELIGYWQSYLYFDAYREEIREIFTARHDSIVRLAKYFTDTINRTCSSCPALPNTTHRELRQAFQTRYNITWISIHIRRQDFRGLGYSSDDHYIRHAITLFRRRYYRKDVRFLVASDDRGYCRELFASEQKSGRVILLPDHFSPADDLIALSLCHHSIVTAGTYGFWSGYLAGGEVIHDVRYKIGCSRTEYYPPWFMLIGPMEDKKI